MIRAPDWFTFKTQLLSGLPQTMVSFIFDKGCSAESSSTETILYYAREAEEIFWKKKRYQEHKCLVEALSSSKEVSKPKVIASSQPEWSPEQSQSRVREFPRRGNQSRARNGPPRVHEVPPVNRDNHSNDKRPPVPGDQVPQGDQSTNRRSEENKPPSTCYKCGGLGHYSSDKKCPEFNHPGPTRVGPGARMYAACEEHGEPKDLPPQPEEERLAVVHSDSEGSDDHLLGSQYSSEGEPYPLSSEGEHGFDNKDDPEFLRAL
jgi:hypothetical protein